MWGIDKICLKLGPIFYRKTIDPRNLLFCASLIRVVGLAQFNDETL